MKPEPLDRTVEFYQAECQKLSEENKLLKETIDILLSQLQVSQQKWLEADKRADDYALTAIGLLPGRNLFVVK